MASQIFSNSELKEICFKAISFPLWTKIDIKMDSGQTEGVQREEVVKQIQGSFAHLTNSKFDTAKSWEDLYLDLVRQSKSEDPSELIQPTSQQLEKWHQEMEKAEKLAVAIAEKRGDLSPEGLARARKDIWKAIVDSDIEEYLVDSQTSTEVQTGGDRLVLPVAKDEEPLAKGDPSKGNFRSASGEKVFQKTVARAQQAKAAKAYSVKELDLIALRELYGARDFIRAVWGYKLQQQVEQENEAESQAQIFEDIEPDFDQPMGSTFVFEGNQMSGDGVFQQTITGEFQQRVASKALGKGLNAASSLARTSTAVATETGVTTGTVATATATVTTATAATTAAGATTTAATVAGAVGAVAPPVGIAMAAALLVKKALSFGVGIFTGFIKRFSPDIPSKGKIYGKKGIESLFSGGILGNVLMILGFAGGFMVGGLPGALFLGLTGKFGIKLLGGLFGQPANHAQLGSSKKKKGLGVALASSAVVVAAPAWVGIAALVILVMFVFSQFFFLPSAFRAEPPDSEPAGGPEAILKITKEANPTKVIFNGQESQTITYKVTFTSPNGQEIAITNPVDKATDYQQGRQPKDVPIDCGQWPSKVSSTTTVTCTAVVNPVEHDNSTLVNTITVDAKSPDETTQTITAQATVIIGNPKADPPYDFPLAGIIGGADDYEIHNGCPNNKHCGWFVPSHQNITGGIDIDAAAGTSVLSTVTGTIVMAGVHTGGGSKYTSCSNFNLGNHSYCIYPNGIGGYVYIQSDDGQYLVAFLHLNEPDTNLTPGTHVERQQQIGEIAPQLPSTTGTHTHYQVLQNGENLYFSKGAMDRFSQQNVGKCSEGKIESQAQSLSGTTPGTPKNCD